MLNWETSGLEVKHKVLTDGLFTDPQAAVINFSNRRRIGFCSKV